MAADLIEVSGPPAGFGVSVSFRAGSTVVGVSGELDRLSAPCLEALLEAVIDQGAHSVALELADLDFIDAAGLRVLSAGAARVRTLGGSLALRSPSARILRLLEVQRLHGLVALERTKADPGYLGPEEAPGRSRLATHLQAVTALPANLDVVDAALRLVVALARATVGGADGVSVSLRRQGHLSTVAASDQTILDMDSSQYATGEGPCVDASVQGRWFYAEALEDESRWPDFVPRAKALGIKAILSSPLIAAEQSVGALNIYSNSTQAFDTRGQELAAVFAEQASVLLADAGAQVSEDQMNKRLAAALRNRETIALAKGTLMERAAISEEAAYTALRSRSVNHDTPLAEVAAAIVASTQRGHVAASEVAP